MARAVMATLALALALGGCATPSTTLSLPPTSAEVTPTHAELLDLPDPGQELVAAVYDFPDLTGQYKPSDTVTTYSRAVTQGGAMILVKALRDAGRGRWFRVIERSDLNNLLKERQIIRETRQIYAGDQPAQPLPPLVFAGLLIESGIVSYDSNTLTGGAGARYFGIGGSTQYRQDTVTVYVHAVSTQTGEILKTITSRKTIASYALSANVFKFIEYKNLLEIEAGFTVDEPGHFALQQAIEHAVRALVLEGARDGLWGFRDPAAGQVAVERYLAENRPVPPRAAPGTRLARREP